MRPARLTTLALTRALFARRSRLAAVAAKVPSGRLAARTETTAPSPIFAYRAVGVRVVRIVPFAEAVTIALRFAFFAITTPCQDAACAAAGRTRPITATSMRTRFIWFLLDCRPELALSPAVADSCGSGWAATTAPFIG